MLVHTNDTAIRRRPGCLPQSTQSPGCEDVTGDIALIAHRAWTRQQLTTTSKTISTDNGRATRWTAVAARDAINTCHRAHTEPANVTLWVHRFSTSWNSLYAMKVKYVVELYNCTKSCAVRVQLQSVSSSCCCLYHVVCDGL